MNGRRPGLPTSQTDVKARHDKMIKLVEWMLDASAGSGQALDKQLPKAKTPHEQESLKRTIAATDNQIDALMCELNGLTDDEIRIVEGGEI